MTAKKRKKQKVSRTKRNLSVKQKIFCREYIYDWNATRSYLKAYPGCKNANTAGVSASLLLRNPKIKAHIESIQKNLEQIAGVSRLRVLNEHIKLAFSSIAHLHNTWIERKEFEELSDEQKACIAEIDTKIKTEYVYDPDFDEKRPIQAEYVRIKLYDKQRALDSINKMLGYDVAQKMEVTGKDGRDLFTQMPDDELETKVKKMLEAISGK